MRPKATELWARPKARQQIIRHRRDRLVSTKALVESPWAQTKVQFAAVGVREALSPRFGSIKSEEIGAYENQIRRIVAMNKSSITSGLGFGP